MPKLEATTHSEAGQLGNLGHDMGTEDVAPASHISTRRSILGSDRLMKNAKSANRLLRDF